MLDLLALNIFPFLKTSDVVVKNVEIHVTKTELGRYLR